MKKSFRSNLTFYCFILAFILCSCKNIYFQNLNDLINENTTSNSIIIEENTIDCNLYKYMINLRTNKLHTFTHGNKIIDSENNKLATNSEIVEILRNEKYDICKVCYAGLKVSDNFQKKL